jgi:acetophenone carboxylase
MPLDAAMRGDLRAVPEAYRTTPFTLARLRATYAMPGYEPPRRPLSPGDLAAALKERRTVVWGRITHLVPIYTWEALRPGQSVSGGAVLESMATTYPVPPGWILRVDEFGNGQLTRG